MADPTQSIRDKALSFIPGPLGESIAKSKAQKESQIAADEANNLVMQREAPSLPAEAQALVSPQAQSIDRQPADLSSQAVTRQPIEKPVTAFPQAQDSGSAAEALIMSGLKQGQDAASQSIGATDALMAKYEQDEVARKQREDQALSEARKKIEDTDKEVSGFKWDNKSVWEKSSTGQKVALAIGGFLSSINSKSAEAFQNSIQTTLQNDLDQQKANYLSLKEKGKELQSYYGQLVQKFGSEQAADMAMMSAKMQMIQNKLKVTADTAQSKLVAANALKGFELTDAQTGKYKAEAIKLATEQQANVIPGYQNTIADKAKRNKFEETLAQKKTLDFTLNDLDKLVSGSGEAIPFTEKSDRANQLVQDAQLQMKEIKKLGVLSGDDAKRLDDYISAPSIFKSDARMKAQIAGMKDLANKALKAQEYSLGLKPIGSQIGKLK